LELIKNVGFNSTSILLSDEEELVRNNNKDIIPGLVKSKKLFLENIHAPFIDYNKIWYKNDKEKDKLKQTIIECISYCAKHGIPIVVMHITKGYEAPSPNTQGVKLIKELVRYGQELNVIIAIENTRRVDYLNYIFSNVESQHLGFCYDSSHDFLYSPEPGSILKKWGHLLVATHFSDNDGKEDSHWLPSEGIINWDVVRDNFPINTYKGVISLEAFPKDVAKERKEEFLQKALKRIKSLTELLRARNMNNSYIKCANLDVPFENK